MRLSFIVVLCVLPFALGFPFADLLGSVDKCAGNEKNFHGITGKITKFLKNGIGGNDDQKMQQMDEFCKKEVNPATECANGKLKEAQDSGKLDFGLNKKTLKKFFKSTQMIGASQDAALMCGEGKKAAIGAQDCLGDILGEMVSGDETCVKRAKAAFMMGTPKVTNFLKYLTLGKTCYEELAKSRCKRAAAKKAAKEFFKHQVLNKTKFFTKFFASAGPTTHAIGSLIALCALIVLF